MADKYILDQNGEPVAEPNLMKWAAWFEMAERTVAVDLIETAKGTYRVSTVFLGLDHQYGDGPPLIFETMVFAVSNPANEWMDVHATRYSTRAQAVAGHAAMIERVKATT